MKTFKGWLEKAQDFRTSVLNLPSGDMMHYIWCLTVTQGTEWDVSLEHRHMFNSSIIIVLNQSEDILGHLTWPQLVQANGVIHQRHLKPLEDYVIFPWETQEISLSVPKTPPKYRMTWLHDLAGTREMFDSVQMHRVERRLRARTLLELDEADAATRGFCDLLFEVFGDARLAQKRRELERLAFLDAMRNVTERNVIIWLHDNGFDLARYWVPATVQDNQCFIEKFQIQPHELHLMPKGCFEVPYEDFPGSHLPIYGPQGTAHLTYRDVPEWAWQHYERFLQHMKRIAPSIDKTDERFRYLLSAVAANERHFQATNRQPLMSDKTADISDIEDLFKSKALPPCLQRTLEGYSEKHYKDKERTQIVAQLQAGKVPLSVVAKIFNEDKSTWDYEYFYNAQYGGHTCATFISNCGSGTIQCPFKENHQMACHQEFIRLHPNKVKQSDELKRPFQWLLWYFLRK